MNINVKRINTIIALIVRKIEVNEKKKICLRHNKEFEYFCFDCHENFCENDKRMKHKNHKIKEIPNDREYFIKYLLKEYLPEN